MAIVLNDMIAPTTRGDMTYLPTSNWKYGLVASGSITLTATSICNSYKSSKGAYGGSNIYDNCYLIASSSNNNSVIAPSGSRVYGLIGGQSGTVSQSLVSGSSAGNGSVGNFTWVDGANSGIQAGRFLATSFQETIPVTPYNLYLPNSVFISASVPYTSGLPFPTISPSGSITASGDYFTGAQTIGTGKILQISQSCRIYFTGAFSTSGAGRIVIAPSCSVKFYMGGTISISGTGITNMGQLPQTFVFYNITNNNWTLSQTETWYGCIESQNGTVTFSTDVYGYVIGKAITLSGTGRSFHMDESVTRNLS